MDDGNLVLRNVKDDESGKGHSLRISVMLSNSGFTLARMSPPPRANGTWRFLLLECGFCVVLVVVVLELVVTGVVLLGATDRQKSQFIEI